MKDEIAAVYCRLSKEDIDKDSGRTESESIKNQKSMLEAYAQEQNWKIFDFYIDEDYSGSDRDRPEFNRLITDSLLGCFNIVLCKKQSRFARDIEYVEKYIHGLFAERRIRFVAVLDNIDTGTVSRCVRKASQINSLVDEWYLSDLSENIISALNTKRKNAEFIGSWAPYGYRKNPENKNVLLIDPEAAENVKMIYEWYLNGWGISRIAGKLNSRQIPNPLLYKQLKGEKINPNPDKMTDKRYLWSPSSVSSILHNQTYTGCLVQGKYKKVSYKSKKLIRIPSSDWIVISGCHEPIIEGQIWLTVQKKMESKCRTSSLRQQYHPISGKVFCGECNSRLILSGGRSGKRKTTYYCCSKHRVSPNSCAGARIETARLEAILLGRIRTLSVELYDEAYLADQIEPNHISALETARLDSRFDALKDRSSVLHRKKVILYSDKLEGVISHDLFLEFCSKLEQEEKDLLVQQHSLREELSLLRGIQPEPMSAVKIPECFNTPTILTREMADHLIESVYIRRREKGKPQEITINWNF